MFSLTSEICPTVSPSQTYQSLKFCPPSPPRECQSTQKDKYVMSSLLYNYGTNDHPYLDNPFFKLQITQGKLIKSRKGKPLLELILQDEEDLKGLLQLSDGFRQILYKYKKEHRLYQFDPKNSHGTCDVVHYQRNSCGEYIVGALPKITLKIDNRSIFQIAKLCPDGFKYRYETIDHKYLFDKIVTCSVIINPSNLITFVSPSPQIYVKSCIVLSIKQIEVEHTMDEKINEYILQNTERVKCMNNIISKCMDEDEVPKSNCIQKEDKAQNSKCVSEFAISQNGKICLTKM